MALRLNDDGLLDDVASRCSPPEIDLIARALPKNYLLRYF